MIDKAVFFFFLVFVLLGLHPLHVEVPRLGVELELQLLAFTTAAATATSDTSCICHLYHSSWQCWILNPMSKARDRTPKLMVPSWIHFRWAIMGTPI